MCPPLAVALLPISDSSPSLFVSFHLLFLVSTPSPSLILLLFSFFFFFSLRGISGGRWGGFSLQRTAECLMNLMSFTSLCHLSLSRSSFLLFLPSSCHSSTCPRVFHLLCFSLFTSQEPSSWLLGNKSRPGDTPGESGFFLFFVFFFRFFLYGKILKPLHKWGRKAHFRWEGGSTLRIRCQNALKFQRKLSLILQPLHRVR